MISAANLSIQFGAKPLFENVSVTFGNGNRYGLIGANGSGKSTFMKIMAGELEPTAGNVATDPNARVGQLRQDQFAYENCRVLDTVIMGHGLHRDEWCRPIAPTGPRRVRTAFGRCYSHRSRKHEPSHAR